MEKRGVKTFTGLMLVGILLVSCLFVGCGTANNKANIEEFYETVTASQNCLDEVADDIYSYWYDAIYEDKYGGNINLAIAKAQADNEINLNSIEQYDITIKDLYKKIRDSELKDQIKEVMTAYSDYYEFVVNVSGSFKSYSASKETLKKELASALKNLALEM